MRLFFSLLSILVTVVLVEGVIRFTGSWREIDYDLRDHFRNPGIEGVPYLLKPNLDIEWTGLRLVTNSLGLADPREPGPAASCRRILVLGSSTTQGFGVESADAYPRALERLLNAEKGDPCYEVINAGQDAYTVREKAALLRYLRPLYQPSLVIVDLNPYDYDDSLSVDKRGFLIESPSSAHKHDWLRTNWEKREDPLEPYLGFSYAYRYFRPRVRGLLAPRSERVRSAIFVSPIFQRRFAEGIRAVEAAAVGLPLVFLPMDVPYAPEMFSPSSVVVDAATVVGEPYPRFLGRYSLGWDSHPNRRGHAVLAAGLRDALAGRKLIELPAAAEHEKYDAATERAELARLREEAVATYAAGVDFESGKNLRQLVGGIDADLFYDGHRSEVAVVLRARGADMLAIEGSLSKEARGDLVARVTQAGVTQIFAFETGVGNFSVRLPISRLGDGLVDVGVGCEVPRCGGRSFRSIRLEEKSAHQ